jgi:L-asparaginase
MRHVTLITTGGTVEKTFNEESGVMENRTSIVRRMLRRLRLEDTTLRVIELLSKDSLYMTEQDREAIAACADKAGAGPNAEHATQGIVILHGTDTLSLTGEHLCRVLAPPRVPVVLTGAMRPFEMKRSDALQNLTEAVFATSLLAPGVYCVAHGRALAFPGVVKDRSAGTFRHLPGR